MGVLVVILPAPGGGGVLTSGTSHSLDITLYGKPYSDVFSTIG